MNSEERRGRLLQLLRRRGPWLVDELAERLGAARRTVLRDLATLRRRGYSITGETGPGGGVRLDPGSLLPDAQLRADDVASLVVAVAVARATPGIPFSASALNALARIERSLPAERLRDLRRFLSRLLVGHPTLPGREVKSLIAADLLPAFERAFREARVLRFRYVDRFGRKTLRRVEPHGMLLRAPLWFAIGWDLGVAGPRLFRMDRMHAPEVSDQSFVPRPHQLMTGVCPDGVAFSALMASGP